MRLGTTGGGPRILLALRRWSAWSRSSLIWPRWRVLEGSIGDLHRAHDAWRLLNWMGFGLAHPWFQDVVFQRFAICCHHGTCLSSSMVKSQAENAISANLWGLVMVNRVFDAKRNALGDLWLVAAVSASRGDSIGEVQSLIFQGKNQRSGLNWFWLSMTFLKVLFWECRLSLRWKPMIYDRTITLVHCFLLESVAFTKVRLQGCLRGGCAIATRNRSL
jgi:hypothetical protein